MRDVQGTSDGVAVAVILSVGVTDREFSDMPCVTVQHNRGSAMGCASVV